MVGGGAAGFFAAIAAAEQGVAVTILEKTSRFLDKVRISGGGRCNVTHACFEARGFSRRYPRGEKALIGALQQFSAGDTVQWFAARGVKLKTESDGRMFPTTDRSKTIMECLVDAARAANVNLQLNAAAENVMRLERGGFEVTLASGENISCDKLLLATGGCRAAAGAQIAVSLGHTLEPPVPSLFTFHIESPWLRSLAGVATEVEARVPDTKLRERGPLLITHWGASGPAILRLSAWGARALHELNYDFQLLVNWLPELNAEKIFVELATLRDTFPARLIVNTQLAPLPSRLWEALVLAAGIARYTRWASLTRKQSHALTQQLMLTEFSVTGKSLNKDEFVTCGGVKLSEVNFKTMESRVCPGLYLAGELLDLDGMTGGFNFQAAWTTGWLAGRAMAM